MRHLSINLDTAPDSQLVSIKTFCEHYDVSPATTYRHHKAGNLPFHKIGKLTRIRLGDARRFIGDAK